MLNKIKDFGKNLVPGSKDKEKKDASNLEMVNNNKMISNNNEMNNNSGQITIEQSNNPSENIEIQPHFQTDQQIIPSSDDPNMPPGKTGKKGKGLGLNNISKKGGEIFNKGKNFISQGAKKGVEGVVNYIDLFKWEKNIVQSKVTAPIKEFVSVAKEVINAWVRRQVEKYIEDSLTKARPKVKEALKQPGMWKWVQKLIDDIVDELYPDIQQEIMYQLKLVYDKPIAPKPEIRTEFLILKPWYWIRRKYLYATWPVDMNIWQTSKTCAWWIFLFISLFPFWGVQSLFYVIIFLMIDKSDEYQLVNYILNFKTFQFFTQGAINGVIGYILYFSCFSVGKFTSLSDFDDCKESGPAVTVSYGSDFTGFLLQIVLVWIAFLMLPCSKNKGMPKFKYTDMFKDEEKDKDMNEKFCCCCSINSKRGGRLKKFMIYDLIAFGCSVGLFFILTYVGESTTDWQIKSTFYLSKVTYGFLSFPFLIFAIPGMSLLLTKCRPTAYDKDGFCVPVVRGNILPEPTDEESDILLMKADIENLVDDNDNEEDSDEEDIDIGNDPETHNLK